uniref:Annexin n=1 Tax=Parastrongyloides trichosuri TaxID=131310 RepID=A0A0N4ZNZ5_PARTI
MHANKRGTISDYPYFNPSNDAENIKNSLREHSKKVDCVINILCKRSNLQRQRIRDAYRRLYGSDLLEDLKRAFDEDFRNFVIAIMTPKYEFEAKELYNAIDGFGTTEETLTEILCSSTNDEINNIKRAYSTLYKKELENDVGGDTSDAYKKLLINILRIPRANCSDVNQSFAQEDARKLYKEGEGRWGTDDQLFATVFATRSYCQLLNIFEEYQKSTNSTIEQAIDNEFSSDSRSAFHAIIDVARSTPDYFVKLLDKYLTDSGKKYKKYIQRIIVSRSEIDLKDIVETYRSNTGSNLGERIKNKFSNDVGDGLSALINGN